MKNTIIICVAKDGLQDFQSISEALIYASKHQNDYIIISISNGVYKEKLWINQANITLLGEDKDKTIIEYDDYANFIMEDGEKRGTFRTPTVFVDCNDFTAKNITFSNSSGPGPKVGQALALYVDGDRIIFENCKFLGGQDTLFAAPLPPTAFEKNGFRGPKEFEPRLHGRHYYKNCYICGDVDFIFGGGTCYFDECELFSNNIGKEVNGYVAAPSTGKGKHGFVFNRCKFTSDCPKNSVYLARPWRNHGKVVILNSYIGKHIKEEGFDDWGKVDARETVYFAEYGNFGEGAKLNNRVSWSKVLTEEEALHYTKEEILGFDCYKGVDIRSE